MIVSLPKASALILGVAAKLHLIRRNKLEADHLTRFVVSQKVRKARGLPDFLSSLASRAIVLRI